MEIKLKIAELPKSGKINSLIDYATDNKSLIFSDSFEKYSCSTKNPFTILLWTKTFKNIPLCELMSFCKTGHKNNTNKE